MTRVPPRPLARITKARETGGNPDRVERENLRGRNEDSRDRQRGQAEGRLLMIAGLFAVAFCAVGVKNYRLAASEPTEPRAAVSTHAIASQRADITDRKGRLLATNLSTHSLYAQPHMMTDRKRAARELAAIFSDLNEDSLSRRFDGARKFLWIKKTISPEQKQAVHDIGEPGLVFGPREMRLYPNGRLAAHILGGTSFGREGAHSAEVIGVAGVEKYFDERLRDPARARPLRLSIDITAQAAVRQVLRGGMRLMHAKGAAAVLMDVKTGGILAMMSLPDFDPNARPKPLVRGDASDSPLFNRAVQGLYELGSPFKIFTAAQAMDIGLVDAGTWVDTAGPLTWGEFKIRDFRDHGSVMTMTDVIVKSSNIGTARVAAKIAGERQKTFLGELGLLDPLPVELVEAAGVRPLAPKRWSKISTMTISYGHGLSTSPLHLAAAYATLANGGIKVTPTLLASDAPAGGPRVVSPETARVALGMLRQTVIRGTASMGEVAGYDVGGKTGTADKPRRDGRGYYDDKVVATFASVFPVSDPRYVLVVSLDEPVETSGSQPRRTAGWTAVPVAAEIIRRTAPLLGLRPEYPSADGQSASTGSTRLAGN